MAYGMILLVIWTPPPWQKPLWYTAAAVITALIALRFEGWSAMGVRWGDLVALVVGGGGSAGCSGGDPDGGGAIPYAAPSAAFPSCGSVRGLRRVGVRSATAAQGFFHVAHPARDGEAGTSTAAGAIRFATAHVPNPLLVPLTLLWGS